MTAPLAGPAPRTSGRRVSGSAEGSAEKSSFRFRLLGSFAVDRDGDPIPDREIGSRKGRTLLKLLLLDRGHLVPVDRIAEALWADAQPEKLERDVATLVSRLRSVFGPGAISGGAGGYRFDPSDRLVVDVDEAQRLVAESEARLAAGDHALSRAAADRAMEILGSGGLLEEEPYADWATSARATAGALVRRALRCSWEGAIRLSDFEGAARAARQAVDADPLDEEAHRALMDAYHRGGQSARALEVYEQLRGTLTADLGIDPDPETRRLHLAILREEPPQIREEPSVRTSAREPSEAGFVGRDDELAGLTERWSQAVAGHPSLVYVVGEGGIGKTRLAEEVIEMAAGTGGLVLRARCFEAERSLFLEPVVDALRSFARSARPDLLRDLIGEWAGTLGDLVPEVGQILRPRDYIPATPEIERRRAFEAIRAFVAALASRGPVLLFLDDVHNAGSSTLELLHFLMRRATGCRLLALVTGRIEEDEETLAHLEEMAIRVELGPLPAEAVSKLARAAGAADLAERIQMLTRGHTLSVVETLRELIERGPKATATSVPESLVAAVLGRVRRLGPETGEFLRAAAILGSAFDVSAAARLAEITVGDAVRRAELARRARLLHEAGPDFEFANDLIQEILYQTTPAPTRIVRHRRAGEVLADNPEAVARHAAAASDWPQAVEAGLAAAARAAARFANLDAERLLDEALLAAKRAGDPSGEARVLLARGEVLERLARYPQAYEDLAAAADLARLSGERAVEMQALRSLGGDIPIAAGRRTGGSVSHLETALGIAEELGDGSAEVDILSRLAIIHTNRLAFGSGYERARRALGRARELGDDRVLAAALDGLKTVAAYSGDLATLETTLPELERLLRRHGELRRLQWTLFESAFVPMARGQWDRAIERIGAALEVNRKSGYLGYPPMFVAHLGWIHRSRGNLGGAVESGERAVAMAQEFGHPWWIAFAQTMLGWTLTELAAYEEAVDHLQLGLEAAKRDEAENYLVRCLAHLALARWKAGDAEGARGPLERAERILAGISASPTVSFLHGAHATVAAARVRVEMGDVDRAEEILLPLLAAAEAEGWVEPIADAAVLLGACRRLRDDRAGAESFFARGLRVGEEAEIPRAVWAAHEELAELSSKAGRTKDARVHRARAREAIERLAASIEDPQLRQRFLTARGVSSAPLA
jgi:DNA-binding SARP family transcriptional activator